MGLLELVIKEKVIMKKFFNITLIMMLAFVMSATMYAQSGDSYTIDWWHVNSGGSSKSENGRFEVRGSVSTFGGGVATSNNGRFALHSGIPPQTNGVSTYAVYIPIVIR